MSILEWFLKDPVTLKPGVMMEKQLQFFDQINAVLVSFKNIKNRINPTVNGVSASILKIKQSVISFIRTAFISNLSVFFKLKTVSLHHGLAVSYSPTAVYTLSQLSRSAGLGLMNVICLALIIHLWVIFSCLGLIICLLKLHKSLIKHNNR